jgi:hypothetical protein
MLWDFEIPRPSARKFCVSNSNNERKSIVYKYTPVYRITNLFRFQCSNCRGVSLLCTACKIFTTILLNRLKPYSENIRGEYQAGFRKSRSTIDQLYTVRQLLNKCWEFNVDVYQVFVDFTQVYDSIDGNKVFEIMNCFGISTKLVKLVSETMEGAKACIKIRNDLTDHFEVKSTIILLFSFLYNII